MTPTRVEANKCSAISRPTIWVPSTSLTRLQLGWREPLLWQVALSKLCTIEDSDEADVPESTEEVPHQQKNCTTNHHKCHVAGAAMSKQSKKKQPLVIELSSDSISLATSDYKLKDNIEMKEEDQDSHISSVESEYEQASSSHKHKPKTMYPSWKTKKVAADELRKELPPIKSSKGKQPAHVAGKRWTTCCILTSPLLVNTSSDEGYTPQQVPVHKVPLVQSEQPSPEQHTQSSATEASKQASTTHHTQPPAEAQVQCSTVHHTQLPAEVWEQPSTAHCMQPPVEAHIQPSTLHQTQPPAEAREQPSILCHTQPPADHVQLSTSCQTQPPVEAQVQPSTVCHTWPPMEAQAQLSTMCHTQLPAEACVQCSSVEDPLFDSVDTRSMSSMIYGI